jgi:monoamine oxidase
MTGETDRDIVDVWVTQWNLDPLTGGVYSSLGVGGTPEDRVVLGTPVHPRVVLAGEYTSVDYPATMHGAFHSGERAAGHLALIDPGAHIIVIGAGISGLVAGQRLIAQGKRVTIFESTEYLGGRARVEQRPDGSKFHAGAAWIHGTDGNPIATLATENNVTFAPWPSSTHNDVEFDRSGDRLSAVQTATIASAYANLHMRVELATMRARESGDQDVTVRGELREELNKIEDPAIRASVAVRAQLHYESLMAGFLDDLSLQYGNETFEYPGGDAYVTMPLSPILNSLSRELTILHRHHVHTLTYDHDDDGGVRVDLIDAFGQSQTMSADACVIATALTPLQNEKLTLYPPLPTSHAVALSRLRMGHKAKVFARFTTRWWGDLERMRVSAGVALSNAEDDPTDISAIGVWVDASSVSGTPTLCGFVGGREAVRLQVLSREADAGNGPARNELLRIVRAHLPQW